MKQSMILSVLVGLVVALGSTAHAQSSFDDLGANEGVLKRARAMNTKQEVRIVQKRSVDRDMRFELGVGFGGVAGGNSYLSTQPLSGELNFHISPRFSFGARYSHYSNQLTNEGEAQFKAAQAAKAAGQVDFTVPEVDFPTASTMLTAAYYPIYGKLNFFDISVVQFDLYVLGGYGKMDLKSGSSDTWTAGGGVGFWWTKHMSSRFEVRHQAYQDQVYTGKRDVGMIVGTFGIGLLL